MSGASAAPVFLSLLRMSLCRILLSPFLSSVLASPSRLPDLAIRLRMLSALAEDLSSAYTYIYIYIERERERDR